MDRLREGPDRSSNRPAWPGLSPQEWESASPPSDIQALERLCADRELSTNEIVESNACYGIAGVIKRWAGTPQDRPLMIALPHGVEHESSQPFSHHELVPVIASCCTTASQPYRTMPIGRLWFMAQPYVHVHSMLAKHDAPARHGSIFFPQHSTVAASIEYSIEAVSKELNALPAEYQPVTVCLYWADVLRGIHEAYLSAGFDVTSSGHVWDRLFLYRFHRICVRHRFAIHHDFGSAVAFSIKSGCRAVSIGAERPDVVRRGGDAGRGSGVVRKRKWVSEVNTVRRLGEMSDREQRDWADHMLGSEFLRTPAETAAMIRRAERLDRIGFLAERGATGRRNPLMIPTMFRRAGRRATPDVVRRAARPVMKQLRADPAA
jgi:hypothetical protein